MLRQDIIENDRIYLPAGNAKFALIDVGDIGNVTAEILISPNVHDGKAYDLTNDKLLTFGEMSEIMSDIVGRKIHYKSPNLLSFYINKRNERLAPMYILVMIMLHFLPRFQKQPALTDCVEQLTSEKPRTFESFVRQNKSLWQKD